MPPAVDTSTTGTFSFTGSVTSRDGQSATVTIHYNVVAPQSTPPEQSTAPQQSSPSAQFNLPNQAATTPKTTAPSFTAVSQSHRRWRLGSKPARVAAAAKPPVGTTFRFTLNEAATVRFTFAQLLSGRKVNGKCVAQTVANRSHKACTRTVLRGSVSFSAGAGPHQLFFQGRLTRTGTP